MQSPNIDKYLNEHILLNKPPVWNAFSQVYQLDFGGRVTQESAKNFQIEYQGQLVSYKEAQINAFESTPLNWNVHDERGQMTQILFSNHSSLFFSIPLYIRLCNLDALTIVHTL